MKKALLGKKKIERQSIKMHMIRGEGSFLGKGISLQVHHRPYPFRVSPV